MDELKFYDLLSKAANDTMSIHGKILSHRNNNKWHLCKRGSSSIVHACENGSPPDLSAKLHNRSYLQGIVERSCSVEEPAEMLERSRICSFCERILEDEFNIERIVVATTDDKSADMRRFEEKRESVRNS
jgi:hypothetical protein